MKTKVIVKADDNQHKDFKKGEVGYIDGYASSHECIHAIVVIGDRMEMIKPHLLEPVGFHTEIDKVSKE